MEVSRVIIWFFKQVEEGIILEVDCVAHPVFFHYCTTLMQPLTLKRYAIYLRNKFAQKLSRHLALQCRG